MKKISIIILFLLAACSSFNSETATYQIVYPEKKQDGLFKLHYAIINTITHDTVFKYGDIARMKPETNLYIHKNIFFMFSRHDFLSDPPSSSLYIYGGTIINDSAAFAIRHKFGKYDGELSSKFEGDKLTIFRTDSIIEFDLTKLKEIRRYPRIEGK